MQEVWSSPHDEEKGDGQGSHWRSPSEASQVLQGEQLSLWYVPQSRERDNAPDCSRPGRSQTSIEDRRRTEESASRLTIVVASSDSLRTIESCGSTQLSREEYYIVGLSPSLHPINERATVDAPSLMERAMIVSSAAPNLNVFFATSTSRVHRPVFILVRATTTAGQPNGAERNCGKHKLD
jgi:hypothetical protein